MGRTAAQRGQAAVELVALLPALALLIVLGWQIALAAHGWIAASGAARTGARAHEVGAPLEAAARAAIPRDGVRVSARVGAGGATRVVVRAPAVRAARWLPVLTLEVAAPVRAEAAP